METYIRLSNLNDFIFCPKSIYYHNLYENYEKKLYQEEVQIAGSIAHESIDNKTYSTSKNILQGIDVYCEKYQICGKIDQFFIQEGKLVERKNQLNKESISLKKLQLWGQMFCLEEMGYEVRSLEFYSMQDNKKYKIYKPNSKELLKFEEMLERYRKYDMLQKHFQQNTQKCLKCIYRELCDYFIGEVYPQLSLFETEEK